MKTSTSQLAMLKTLAEQYKITGDKLSPTDQQLSFVREQVIGMKAITFRLLFDIALSLNHEHSAKDESTKSAYRNQALGYENDLRNKSLALDVAMQLEKELEDQLAKETE